MENNLKDKSIVVLPFVNMSGDSENEYFCDGITEEIINALSNIEQLNVISRTSSFYFKNKNIPLKQIVDQLNAEIILEGSVRIESSKVRITAKLIQASDEIQFWSETWNRKLEKLLEVQDEISILIADKLREQIGHLEIKDHLVEDKTHNLKSYNLFLKAKYYFNKWNPDDVETSIDLFERALEIDPNFTDAYVGIADAYSFMATTKFMPVEIAWKKSVEFTHKAYTLNPENAGVHYLLANLSFFTDCNFNDAYQHISKALQFKPSYPEAQQYIAFLYMISGDMKKAQHHLQFALGIDPLNQETLFYKGYYYYRSEEFDKALKVFEELLSKNPKNIPAFVVYSYCMILLKKYDELIKIIEKVPEDILIPHEQLGILCLIYILKGDKKNAACYLKKLETEAKKPAAFQAHSYLFLAYANLNRFDEAFKLLEKAIKLKSSILLLSFSDPLASNIKKDSRYKKFHKRLYYGTGEEAAPKKKPALLSNEVTKVYTEKIVAFLEKEKPFLNPTISLRELAEQIQIHPNQLSWLLNEKFGKKFNDFINSYRIKYFKELAKNPANSNISILGLAYESGFNSKSVFNTSFKKETGLTPKQFLNTLK